MENQNRPLYFYGKKNFTIQKGKEKVKVERRITLAGVVDDKGIINIGRAVCSEKDQFVKATARKIATGRSGKKPVSMLKVVEGEKPAITFLNFAKSHLVEVEVEPLKRRK